MNWQILTYLDWTLFFLVSFTVLYMTIFAVTSLITRHSETPKTKKFNRFVILIPTYHNGISILRTVTSILGQTYPQRMFDVTVIAEHEDEMTNFKLAQYPITLLTPTFEKSSKSKALQLAINNLPQFKIYDVVIILNAGNMVEPEFLEQMNEAYEAAGTKAIQAHRLSLNRDTTSARLNSVFEEINNSIFRRGHIAIGMSAALSDSGMAYDFNWFKQNIMKVKAETEDKEMEAQLMLQHIYIDYFDDIPVYDEKVRLADDFNRQHGNWMLTQIRTIFRHIRHLPMAVINRHYDWIDKIIQWMLLPRMIMMAIIVAMGVILPFIYFTMALKWWFLFALILFVFAVATPNYLVDDKWDRTFFSIPIVVLSSLLKRFPAGRKLQAFVNK